MRFPPRYLLVVALLFTPIFTHAAAKPLLDDVTLRANPSREDVVAYLKKLKSAIHSHSNHTKGGPFEGDEPIISPEMVAEKLNQVPSEYIELICKDGASLSSETRLDVVFQGGKGVLQSTRANSVYWQSISSRSDLTPQQAEGIGRYLADNQQLIEVVYRYNWENLLQKAIIKQAARVQNDTDLSKYAFALAKIKTPESLKLLAELMTRGDAGTMAQTYYSVARYDLESLDWQKIVETSWTLAKKDPEDVASYAPIAASYGITEALVVLAKKLNANPNYSDPQQIMLRPRLQTALMMLVDTAPTTNEALVEYVLDNRDRLSFDKEWRVYRLR
ncbi:MAG: hypothetical protein QM790_05850 [Nibricoccus sp.]